MEKQRGFLFILLKSLGFSDIRRLFRRAGKVSFLILFQLIFIGSYATAQKVALTGTVLDQKGGALPGVTVQVKGTSSGTVTDMNGKYIKRYTNVFFCGYVIQRDSRKRAVKY